MSDIIVESQKGVKPHLLIVQQIIDKKKKEVKNKNE